MNIQTVNNALLIAVAMLALRKLLEVGSGSSSYRIWAVLE